jgi:hypothetical protein
MQSLFKTCFRYAFIALVFPLALTFALATKTSAQSSADDRTRAMIERDQRNREWQLRNLGKVQKVDINVLPVAVSLKNVKEDYEGLQSANNSILKMLSSKKEVDYKLVSSAASEIKKRAGRLRSYLLILKMAEENNDKKSSDEIVLTGMRASLLSLDASIFNLITNPIFKNFGQVVDANNSVKARDSLDNIISLSDRIKKSVERSMRATR